jgi:mono/diheme cytochrome c family protein
MLKILKKILYGAIFATLTFVVSIYIISEKQLNVTYSVEHYPDLLLSRDSSVLKRGKYLSIVANCVLCHGSDLSGHTYYEGALGIIAGPNLTSGHGGIGDDFTINDWVRAIRHGIRKDGTSLILMPSEVYVHMSRADLSAIVSYIKSVAPVDNVAPQTQFYLPGRALLAFKKLPLLVAAKTNHTYPILEQNPKTRLDYGAYLTDILSCKGCHGSNLSGGRRTASPGAPLSSNLTGAGLRHGGREQFMKTMRTGLKSNGLPIDDIMPWRNSAQLTTDDLDAIWTYLETLPPTPTGVRE